MSQEFEGNTLALPVLHHVNLKTIRMQETVDWSHLMILVLPYRSLLRD